MDYHDYRKNLECYHVLEQLHFQTDEKKEVVIQRLIDAANKKHQIFEENNAILKEYVDVYEKDPSLLDKRAVEVLRNFSESILMEGQQKSPLDNMTSLRISKILLNYYEKIGDLEHAIEFLERCCVYDLMNREHLESAERCPFFSYIERYQANYDSFSENAKIKFLILYFRSIIDRCNLSNALKRYKEIQNFLDEKATSELKNPLVRLQLLMTRLNLLNIVNEICRCVEYEKNRGMVYSGSRIDISAEKEYLMNICQLTRNDYAEISIYDRVMCQLIFDEFDYHAGNISLEELLSRLKKSAEIKEDYSPLEVYSALFQANCYYMEYLYKCSTYPKEYVKEKSMQVVDYVLAESKKRFHENDFQKNYYILMFVNAASNILDFSYFKNTVLEITIYTNKALYTHTAIVKEICCVILQYILEHDPAYLSGVCGYKEEFIRSNPHKIIDLMKDCAMFHDIGKYFCLDYVSNSYRNITDDEYEIIKTHTTNFEKVYQGMNTPEIICIKDCAFLHHRWYNEKGGYPQISHTENKPFVNILSIADSIDAATDQIGRPYGKENSLEGLIEEFCSAGDARYSAYVSNLLRVDEIKEKINYLITEGRKEINYRIYTLAENIGIEDIFYGL